MVFSLRSSFSSHCSWIYREVCNRRRSGQEYRWPDFKSHNTTVHIFIGWGSTLKKEQKKPHNYVDMSLEQNVLVMFNEYIKEPKNSLSLLIQNMSSGLKDSVYIETKTFLTVIQQWHHTTLAAKFRRQRKSIFFIRYIPICYFLYLPLIYVFNQAT